MSSELAWLKERLEQAIGKLPGVTTKRMFGCDAFFRDGLIFALVWKEGRVGVKLRDASSYAALAAIDGAEPWTPGGKMIMSQWLLVPAEWNEDDDALRPWVARAHAQVSQESGSAKKTAAKKTAAKKTAAKKTARR